MLPEAYNAPPFLAELAANVEFVKVIVEPIIFEIAPPPPNVPSALFEQNLTLVNYNATGSSEYAATAPPSPAIFEINVALLTVEGDASQ